METLLQDLRYGLRVLTRNPGFSAVALLALVLGIGAITAIFTIVNSILLRPLPYKQPDRLVMVWETEPGDNPRSAKSSVAPPDFFDWRNQSQSFEHIAGIRGQVFDLTGEGQPEQLLGAGVSFDFFDMLGARAAAGRFFLGEEDQTSGQRVVVISHKLWQRRFNADPGAVGHALTMSGKSYTVVGVAPKDFRTPMFYGEEGDIWIPLAHVEDKLTERNNRFIQVIGQLKPGLSIEQAESEMNVIAAQLRQQYPESNTGVGVNLVGLKEEVIGDIGPKLLMLIGAVGFVLLIACSNVANMLLARAASRQKEIAIRLAIGASRWRIVRQLIIESVLLAVVGGALGLLFAMWGVDVLVALSPEDIPRLAEIAIDRYVLGFAFLISVLTGVVFGLAPALQASSPNVNSSLKEGGGAATTSFRGDRLRSFLVVAEVALALVLLIGAGLLINSLLRLQNVSPGFDPDGVITMRVFLSPKYEEQPKQIAFFKELIERVESLPGAESVGAINDLPMSGNQSITGITIEGQPSEPDQEPRTEWRQISPNYFRTMAIGLLAGRDFTIQDDRNAPAVVIVNDTFAGRFWPGQDAVGKRMKFGPSNSQGPWRTVIGVVGTIKHLGLDKTEGSCVYLPYLRSPRRGMFVLARTKSDTAGLTAAMQKEVWAIDKDLPIQSVRTMNQFLSRSVAEPRFYSVLLGVFAALALVVASIGIYGVMSYTVAQRTHEIGVRMALGAQSRDVMLMVLGKSFALIGAGIAIGLPAAVAVTRILSSMLFGVTATDLATFAGVSLLLALVAMMASYVPARRATRVDPMVALRYE
jgi:putative ABC transport system permease protein